MPKPIFDNDEPLLDYGAIDEMAALGMGDRGYTDVNPPLDSDNLFNDQFERRASELQRTPSNLQPVHIVPMKNGPWSSNNQLGIQQDFAHPTTTASEQTILKLDEWGFPEVWSIMLGMTYGDDKWDPANLNAAFNVVAAIRAGVGGVTQEVEVDWQQGTSFSLVMNALNVIAVFSASLSTPSDLRLQASICRGKICGRPPQRSFQIAGVVAGTSSTRFRIPPFAKSVMLVDRSAAFASLFTAGNCRLNFFANPNTVANVTGTVTGEQLIQFASNGFPIPTFSRYFEVQALANNVAPTVIFQLAL